MSGRKIERRLWRCPGCARRYNIPAAANDPGLCPKCAIRTTPADENGSGMHQHADADGLHPSSGTDTDRNGILATVSLVFGIVSIAYPVSLTAPFAIPAVILGIWGINSAKRGRAIWGMSLACLAMLMFTFSTVTKYQARKAVNELTVHLNKPSQDVEKTRLRSSTDDTTAIRRAVRSFQDVHHVSSSPKSWSGKPDQRSNRSVLPNKWPAAFRAFGRVRQASPEQEFIRGAVREFRSDGTGKAKGAKLRIQYPASWKSMPGERPHIVRKFSSPHGRDSMMLAVKEPPVEVRNAIDENDAADALRLALSGNNDLNFVYIDAGKVTLAGRPTGWTEFKMHASRVGIDVHMHGVMFNFVHRGLLITVAVDSAWTPTSGAGSAEERFKSRAHLFQLILNSFDLWDRYDD